MDIPKILSKEKALFIICAVINPFISNHVGLLRENSGLYRPIPGAEKIKIDSLLLNIYKNDQRHQLKTIDFILNSIAMKCQQEGFVITLGEEELIEGNFSTIGELAGILTDTSMPIWV
ncbi:MAG: hypothetical protein BWK80_02770 [Desulfobacteraceae bacterium IS3]|nr:MAG: hypothetical protein BWK80_02770 [Desulfobacteraceae bacterium IS3]